MGNGTAIIIEGIACPNAGVCIVKPVIVRIVVELFPSEMAGKEGPHAAGVIQITRPVEMPQQFVDIAKIHIVVVHLIIAAGVTADISIAVLRGSPLLHRACQGEGCVLSRMGNGVRHVNDLTGCIGIKMRTYTVVPTKGIAGICRTPATEGHTPTDSAVQPDFTIPNAIGCHSKGTA